MPTDQPASTPRQQLRPGILALGWLVLLVVDVVHAWFAPRTGLPWGDAGAGLLAISGMLLALSFHRQQQGRHPEPAAKAAFLVVLLAIGAMVVDILTTRGHPGH